MSRALIFERDTAPWLTALLDASSFPGEGEWEGSFKGYTHGGAPFDFRLRMCLRIGADVIEGDGKGIDFPRQDREPRSFALTGSVFARTVEFELYFDASYLRNTALLCEGVLSLDRQEITGAWHLPCFSGCGCKTAAFGNYELRRVSRGVSSGS
ncbi:hypothetical protein [Mesorhizobium sp. L2C084A000]|uniref:hypothetical protein n=1 Tax=Mesorhizobium sp. L2C084A000 TaxID=1287116 RepID=UPI0003CFC7C8|nr:hypothetical protein [Mesorhizobium sp. L2C084A000]ESZ20001.1 hypothetical protein X734_31610 [Mesorhizobium sp. L2C084A000]